MMGMALKGLYKAGTQTFMGCPSAGVRFYVTPTVARFSKSPLEVTSPYCTRSTAETATIPQDSCCKPPTVISMAPRSEGGAYSQGTVFKMTPSGTLTSLYSFCPDPQDNCPDGATPVSGLMQATDGTLYGTTTDGGTHGCATMRHNFQDHPERQSDHTIQLQ